MLRARLQRGKLGDARCEGAQVLGRGGVEPSVLCLPTHTRRAGTRLGGGETAEMHGGEGRVISGQWVDGRSRARRSKEEDKSSWSEWGWGYGGEGEDEEEGRETGEKGWGWGRQVVEGGWGGW